MPLSSTVIAALLLAAGRSIVVVNAHGYLNTPRSRNFVAYQDGKYWPMLATNPLIETEPQSANSGGSCGIISGRNYNQPQNGIHELMKWNTQACYIPGQTIDVAVTLTAHHQGHFEFHACPISTQGQSPSDECFAQYPLTFVSETVSVYENRAPANLDTNYTERAYVNNIDSELHYKFKLPPDLIGEMVLIQWHYITANGGCMHVGYDKYNWPPGWAKPNLGIERIMCNANYQTAEQFWNCAEVKVSNSCGGGSALVSTAKPSASPVTTKPSSSPVTAKPTNRPSSSPSASPVTSSPSASPTASPSASPVTTKPSSSPVTAKPTNRPSSFPSASPITSSPSNSPTSDPSASPVTDSPSASPVTSSPSASPTTSPSASPMTAQPSASPVTAKPTNRQSSSPSVTPTLKPTTSLTPTKVIDTRWYPDQSSTSVGTKCKNDGQAPTWMHYKYVDQATCCTSHFNWAYNDCMGTKPASSNKWYIDWSTGKCKQDCEKSASSASSCGGLVAGTWVSLHESIDACCRAHVSYAVESCKSL